MIPANLFYGNCFSLLKERKKTQNKKGKEILKTAWT